MKITFSVSGYVTQTIESTKNESIETIVDKLNSGEYITTLHGKSPVIENTITGETVAKIVNIDNNLEYEYFEGEE